VDFFLLAVVLGPWAFLVGCLSDKLLGFNGLGKDFLASQKEIKLSKRRVSQGLHLEYVYVPTQSIRRKAGSCGVKKAAWKLAKRIQHNPTNHRVPRALFLKETDIVVLGGILDCLCHPKSSKVNFLYIENPLSWVL